MGSIVRLGVLGAVVSLSLLAPASFARTGPFEEIGPIKDSIGDFVMYRPAVAMDAKGNQVVAEGVVSWNRDAVATETPFISFLLLDEGGFIIRERRYPTMDNWPGAEKVKARLGLEGK